MLQWLKINPDDDQKTKDKKKKLAKSYKSKMRFQKLDVEQKDRQSSWLNFKKGKGSKKKTGFLTGVPSLLPSDHVLPTSAGCHVTEDASAVCLPCWWPGTLSPPCFLCRG